MITKDNLIRKQEAYLGLYKNMLLEYCVSSHSELEDSTAFFNQLRQEWKKYNKAESAWKPSAKWDKFTGEVAVVEDEAIGEITSVRQDHTGLVECTITKTDGTKLYHINLKGAKLLNKIKENSNIEGLDGVWYVLLKGLQKSESRSLDVHKKDKDFHKAKQEENLKLAKEAKVIGNHILRKKYLKIANNHRLEAELHDRAIQHKIKSLASGEVGQTILNQIKSLDRIALMAWGAKEFVTISDPVFDVKEHGEGIRFKVNGSKFKGYVAIILNSQDLYNVFAYTIRGVNVRLKNKMTDISVDGLVETLDNLIG